MIPSMYANVHIGNRSRLIDREHAVNARRAGAFDEQEVET
jgi:hypothetical protein